MARPARGGRGEEAEILIHTHIGHVIGWWAGLAEEGVPPSVESVYCGILIASRAGEITPACRPRGSPASGAPVSRRPVMRVCTGSPLSPARARDGMPGCHHARSGHPRLSVQAAGVEMLKDSRIWAGSLTDSIRVGRMLADIVAAPPAPIPFYGELDSVNPALQAEGAEPIVRGFVASVSGVGRGQRLVERGQRG